MQSKTSSILCARLRLTVEHEFFRREKDAIRNGFSIGFGDKIQAGQPRHIQHPLCIDRTAVSGRWRQGSRLRISAASAVASRKHNAVSAIV